MKRFKKIQKDYRKYSPAFVYVLGDPHFHRHLHMSWGNSHYGKRQYYQYGRAKNINMEGFKGNMKYIPRNLHRSLQDFYSCGYMHRSWDNPHYDERREYCQYRRVFGKAEGKNKRF
jgi:hypothetical protein